MADITVNGVRLHYEEMGSGPETIVFSHSYLVDSSHFYPQMQELRARYRCIAYDHRGHGRSEVTAGGYDMENLYADAVALIEGLECAPCHFVGLSTGGFIGMRIGIRQPKLLQTLVLMDTSADAEPEENVKQYKLLMFVVRWIGYWPVIGKILPLLFSKRFLEDPARQKEVREWKRRLTANDRKAMVKFGQGILSRASVYDQLDQIKTPTLVIVGEADIFTPKARAERIANRIPVAMLLVIPNAGHLCTVEAPAVVTSAIQEFVTAHI